MSDVIDHLKIINNGLARIGGGAIMAEDEDSDLAAQVVPIYRTMIAALLSVYPWNFASKTYKLDAVAKTVENDFIVADDRFMTGYAHGFALPGTRLGDPRRILIDPRNPDAPLREFKVEAGTLYCDYTNVWAVVTVRADPANWHPLFIQAAEELAAAEFCVPVTHDASLAEKLHAKAVGTPQEQGRGGTLGKAIGIDASTSRLRSPLQSDPLTSARFR